MALPGLLSGIDAASARNFKELEIYERVLDTGDRTIAIDQIATISVETRRYRIWKWFFIVAGGLGIASALYTLMANGWRIMQWMPGMVLWPSAMAGGAFLIAYLLRDRTFLQIGAADGSRTVFHSRDRAFLLQVKTFLLKKINEGNTAATQHFHFGDTIAGDKVAGNKIAHRTSVSGSGHQVVAGSAGASISGSSHVNHVTQSPGAQIGHGNISSGTIQQTIRIDYGSVLPQVSEMRAFYGSQPNMQHLEQRLGELEQLMQAGTPSEPERSRLRSLCVDLGSILQAYPAVVQFFQHIAQMAA